MKKFIYSPVGEFTVISSNQIEEIEKVQDFRSLAQLQSAKISLTPDDFYKLKLERDQTKISFIDRSEAYTSDAYITRDLDGYCRFMFEIDIDSLLKEQSKFGKVLTSPNLPGHNEQKIKKMSNITSLMILRRQVDPSQRMNRLQTPFLGFDKPNVYSSEKWIIETSLDDETNLMFPVTTVGPEGTDLGAEQIASIAENPAIVGSPSATRTIMVTDYSVRRLSAGSVQYGIKLSMIDGTVGFLNLRLQTLKNIRVMLDRYKNQLTIPGVKRENIVQYYDNLSNPEKESVRGIIIEDNIGISSNYPWEIAPEYFSDTMDTTPVESEAGIIKGEQYKSSLISLLEVGTATEISVTTVLNMYDILISAYERDLGNSLQNASGIGQKSSGYAGNNRISFIELKDYFPQVFDVELSSYPSICFLGLETKNPKGTFPAAFGKVNFKIETLPGDNSMADSYLSGQIDNSVGIQMMSRDQYLQRINKENVIYWQDEDINNVQEKVSAELTVDAPYFTEEEKRKYENLSRTSYTYLSPAILDGKAGEVIERLDEGARAWSEQEYTKMQNDIIAKTKKQYNGQSSSRSSLDNIINQLNIRVVKPGLPMASQVEIGKNKQTNLLPVSKILGESDKQHKESLKNITPEENSQCAITESDLSQCQAESRASTITQIFSNILARNGNFNEILTGNPRNLKNPYEKINEDKARDKYDLSSPSNFLDASRNSPLNQKSYDMIPNQTKQISLETMAEKQGKSTSALASELGSQYTYGDGPITNFNYNTLAKVRVFEGYESLNDGKSTLKRPKFNTLSSTEWATKLLSLQEGESLLCHLEKYAPTNIVGMTQGLDIPVANEYFLISESDAQNYDFPQIGPSIIAPQIPEDNEVLETATLTVQVEATPVLNGVPAPSEGLEASRDFEDTPDIGDSIL
jgi:hypothetical protein